MMVMKLLTTCDKRQFWSRLNYQHDYDEDGEDSDGGDDNDDGDEVVDNLWLAADLVATLGKGEEGRTDGPLEKKILFHCFSFFKVTVFLIVMMVIRSGKLPINIGSFQRAGRQILVWRSRLWSAPELQYGWLTNSTLLIMIDYDH